MNIIIVGCGRIGRNIADLLNTEEHSITVIDTDTEALDRISDTQNILTIEGNGATLDVLNEAQVSKADLIIAVTQTDELNLYTCLIAKKAGAKNTIARVRNPKYVRDINYLQKDIKLSLAINPEYTAALDIARLLKYPGASKMNTFGGEIADLIKIKIKENSSLCGKRVADCSSLLKDYIKISIVERDDDVFIPNGDFVIEAGDFVSFVTPNKAATKLLKLLGYDSTQGKNIIILGGGKISFYLAKTLHEASFKVKIIEKDYDRCENLSEILDGVTIINGDAMDESLLLSEGIENADAIVSLLATDEENVLVSLYAKQINEKANVITELGNLSLSSIIKNLPLDTVIRPKQLAGETIVRYVRALQNTIDSNVETMYRIADGQAEALEFRITSESDVTGKPLSELPLKSDLQLVCIVRNNRIIIPTGSDTIEIYDTIFVITKHQGLNKVEEILK